MKKRILSVLLALALVVSSMFGLAPAQSVSAATSDTNALYYNTGHRDTDADSLSESALAYYSGFAYDYAKIASGETTVKGADLKRALFSLMRDTLDNLVTYTSLPNYWAYSDAEDGEPGTIYFYTDESNKDVSATLNREHVWPKSHASYYEHNGGTDIHHLRPAIDFVNSYRGNLTMGEIDESKADTVKVNGKVVGYKADNVFEPLPNIKGDIARIFLYVYTCWQQPNLFFDVAADRLPALEKTNSANKNDGLRVIESLETLLQWNYIDPVDTWEMSQNDIGEIIQGNRNVFIDYPEYAWLIFDLDVPEGIVSPVSENRALGTYVPGDLSDKYTEAESQIDESELISIAEANNEAAGKLVTVKGEVIYRFGAGDSLDSAIIRDENGDSIQLYFGGGMFRYHAGDTVMVKGTIAEYHGVKQISGFVSKSVATGNGTASVAPIEVTFEELNANIDNYVSKLVSVKDVVLGSKSDGSITVTQTVDGKESELVLYKAPSYPEGIARTDKVDIIGIATKRDTQAQIRVGSSSDYTLVEKGPGYVADLTTVEGILDAAFSLEDKETLGQAVTLTGKITSIQTAYSSEYNNISVNIEVSGKTILCYRLKGGRTLKVGEVITVTGDIQNYGGTIEFVKDSTYVGENSSSGDATPTPTATTTPTPTGTTTPAPTGTSAPDPTAIPGDVKVLVTEEEEQILEKAFALETGKSLEEECSLRGIVIEITPVQTSSSVSNTKVFAAVKPTYNVKIKTGDKEILCYKLANAEKLKVGDAIKVTGKIQNYQGTVEFKANSTYVKCTTSGVFEKINSVDVLVSGKYVIYATKGDYAGALGNTVKSGKVDPVAVAPENGVFTDPDSNIVWVVEKDAETGVITLYNEAVQKYLVISSNAVAGFELADTAKYGYTVSALQESDPSNIFLKTTLNGSKRGISLFGVDFRAYDANTAINNKAVLNLYRLAAVNLTPVAEPTGTPTPTPTEPTGTPVSAEFEQITSFEDIEDGKYIFVTNLNDVLYALDKAPGEGRGANTRGGVVVTAADGKVYSESTSIVWTVTKVTNDDGSVHYTIQDEDGKYLSMSNTGYNYPFSATTNDDAVSEFTAFVFSAGTNENAVLVQNPANGRYISALINNDAFQDYRGYDAEKKCKPLYLYKLVEKVEPEEPTPEVLIPDGNYVIVNPGSNKAMSTEAIGTYYRAIADITLTGADVETVDAALIWTVTNNTDGTITIANAKGEKLSVNNDNNSLPLNAENTTWNVVKNDDGTFYVVNAVRTDLYIEYYAKYTEFSTFKFSEANAGIYKMQFVPAVAKAQPTATPTPTATATPTPTATATPTPTATATPTATPTPTATATPTPEPKTQYFEQVTELEDLVDGKYIFVTEVAGKFFALDKTPAGESGNNAQSRSAIIVSVNENGFIFTDAASVVWTVINTDDGVLLQDIDGKYLSMSNTSSNACFTANGNKDKADDTSYYTVSKNGDDAFFFFNSKGGRNISAYVNNGVVVNFRGYIPGHNSLNPLMVYRLVDCETEGHRLVFDGEKVICRVCGEVAEGFTGYIANTEGIEVYVAEGILANGYVTVEGTELFFENGLKFTGEITFGNEAGSVVYTFEEGVLVNRNGIEKLADGKFVAFADGEQLFGWQTINGSVYYFDKKTGYMATRNTRIDGVTYKFAADGRHTEGTLVRGWFYSKYYFAGEAVKGFVKINDKTYYFNSDGYMVYGWQKIGEDHYYFTSDGSMATGEVTYLGVKYTFGEDGKHTQGTWVKTGCAKRYYFAGRYVTGWQKIGDDKYCFDSFGDVMTGTVLIGDTVYTFNNNGVLVADGIAFEKYTGYVIIGGIEFYVRKGVVIPFYRLFNGIFGICILF